MRFNTIQSALAHCFHQRNNKIAIEHKGQQFTYAQLAKASDVLMGKLIAADIRKGMHIGVLANDRKIVIAATIAIFKLGCVYVPLDAAHPVHRLNVMRKTADVSYMVVEDALPAELREVWHAEGVTALPVNSDLLFNAASHANYPFYEKEYHENDPLYIFFSSGTTGTPKPILGRNGSIMHFLDWEINTFELWDGIRISQLGSPCHDPYLRDAFATLTVGGTICIPDSRNTILSPFELKNWVNQARVNLIHITPTMFRNLCSGGLAESDFPDLKYVLLAGERLLSKDLRKWYEVFGERMQLANLYGPQETTSIKLFYRISPRDLHNVIIPIGKPISDTSVHILDAEMQPCREGELGELYIDTPYKSLGYYNNDALNQKAFVPDPFSPNGKNIIYKTGDFVKMLPDQNIVFVERKDRQVKVRGNTVELGEIEEELLRFPNVVSSMVQLFKDGDTEVEHLVAYYTSAADIAKEALHAYLKKRLPDFMVPQHYVRLDSFPIVVSGKIDVSRLPNPLEQLSHQTHTPGPAAGTPGDEVEERLRQVWKEILNKDEIGMQDVFMNVGGDSLAIMLLINRVNAEFEFELSLWQVFDDLTIEKLAGYIKEVAVQH
jgi:amino acid adenylation domain-containing protein